MSQTLVTAPTQSPITLAEAKSHLRINGGDDDILITDLILAATEQAEIYTWRRFITQTWKHFMNDFSYVNKLPYGNLQSVSSVKYYDSANVLQTESSAVYDVVTASDPGSLNLAYSQTWPHVYDREAAVEVEFICGYGLQGDVPQSIKNAIKIKVELLYGSLFESEYKQLESTYEALLSPYSIRSM